MRDNENIYIYIKKVIVKIIILMEKGFVVGLSIMLAYWPCDVVDLLPSNEK